jgi:hypothetical protein
MKFPASHHPSGGNPGHPAVRSLFQTAPLLLAVSLSAWLLPSAARAATLVSDNFNDLALDAGLNGRAPNGSTFTNSINSSGWVTNSTLFKGNGAGGLTATTSAARFFSIDLGASYFVNNPGIYELSVDLTAPANGTAISSVQFGFSPTISTNASFITNNGAPWLNYALNGDVTVNGGPASANTFTTTAATGVTHTFTLRLDTTAAQWTLNALIDGIGIDLNGVAAGTSFTYTSNPVTDRYIALSSSGVTATQGTMTIDNFRMESIPEPAGTALLAIGSSFAVLRRRRR